MISEVRISVVSYLNSKPFVYGLQQCGVRGCVIELDSPSVCAEKLLTGKADIGLVPVAIIPFLNKYSILTDYCIGADGAVGSVMLYSEVPLEKIERIFLDYQSKTSVALIQVLAKHFWKITPEWLNAKEGFEQQIGEKAAGIIIGDRTFELGEKYPFSYDLAEEWMKFTGLPFVFACWVANRELPEELVREFNRAIKFGIDNKEKMIQEWKLNEEYGINVKEYLTEKISYSFDSAKKEGLKKFLETI